MRALIWSLIVGERGQQHKLLNLPTKVREAAVRDIVLGRRSMYQVTKDLERDHKFKISDTAVSRFMSNFVGEQERIKILADAAHDAKIAEAVARGELIDEFGEDTDRDLKWVLRELKSLLQDAKDDDERALQLGTLKELRQSLMALADLHGKLNKKMDIHLNLNESPQFIQLRQIILTVLERHPDAKADFLSEMKVLQVCQM